MPVQTFAEFLQVVREPATWCLPFVYNAAHDVDPNKRFVMHRKLLTLPHKQARLKLTRQDPALATAKANPYDVNANVAVADTPYRPATAGTATRIIQDRVIISGVQVQDDFPLVGDAPIEQPKPFQTAAIDNAIDAEINRQLAVGGGGVEMDGLTSAATPKQTIASSPTTNLRTLNTASVMINSGRGNIQPDAIICNPFAMAAINSYSQEAGFTLPTRVDEQLQQEITCWPSPVGLIPIIWNEFLPVNDDGTTSIFVAHLYGPSGVHIGQPEAAQGKQYTSIRLQTQPVSSIIGWWMGALEVLTDNTLVEITNWGPII